MTAVVAVCQFPQWGAGEHGRLYYSVDIALAASAVAEAGAAFGRGARLRRHPTISPIILHTARAPERRRQVKIYQSEFYKGQTTKRCNN